MSHKEKFEIQLEGFIEELHNHVTTNDGQWAVKGFIDAYKNIYTISSDTKIVSKILIFVFYHIQKKLQSLVMLEIYIIIHLH